MIRLKENEELLKILSELIKKCPEQRFGQILSNYGFVNNTKDIFYDESTQTLERVKAYVKNIERQ